MGKLNAEVGRVTPAEGANLVGVDDFEPPEESLYLIGYFEDESAALTALDARKAAPDYNGDALYVYLPPGVERIRPIDADERALVAPVDQSAASAACATARRTRGE